MLIVFFRILLIYILVIFSLRLMGKRQIGQLQPSELVVTILVSNIATMAIEDANIPLFAGIIPILTLVSFDVLISSLMLKFSSVRKIIAGSPRMIIRDGVIDQKQLKNLRFTIDDMMEQLRKASIFDIKDVSFAIVETNGNVSIYPKYSAQAVTAEMLRLENQPAKDAPPVVIISDGVVIKEGLTYCNLRQKWLDNVLGEHGYSLTDIFLMTCNRQADYQIVPIEKNTKKQVNS